MTKITKKENKAILRSYFNLTDSIEKRELFTKALNAMPKQQLLLLLQHCIESGNSEIDIALEENGCGDDE